MARQSRAGYLQSAERGEREALITLASGKNPDGTDFTLPVTSTGSSVSAAAATVTTATLQAAAVATGNGTSLDVSGMAVAVLQTAGTFVGTVTFEFSLDDSQWYTLIGENLATGAIVSTATLTNTAFGFRVAGMKSIRARISAYTSGSITVTGRAQAVNAQLPLTQVAIYNASGSAVAASTPSEGIANATNSLFTVNLPLLFNGTTWDRQRSNIDVTVLASAARTIATNSADIVTYNARVLRVDIDISAVAGSPSLTFTVKAKDGLSGVYSTILASAALSAAGHTVLLIGPGLLAAANAVANAPLPRTFRVEVAVGSADSVTYSIGAVLSV